VMNVLFIRRERVPEAIPDVFALLNTRVAEAFTRKLGLKARHRPINDLEVEIEGVWKKIGPFGISFFGPFICCRMGLTISSMPFDVVEQAVPGPPEKFADKAAKSVTARVGCLNEALGREASVDEVQALLRDAFTDLFGVELRAGCLTDTERGYDDALRTLYDSDEWFWANSVKRRFPEIPSGASLSEHTEKIPNGPLVRARVLQRGDEILDVSLTGWYHGVRPLDALEKVESALKHVPRNEPDITQRIETAYREHDLEIGHCGPADLTKKVWTAAGKEAG
jgi:hypothetical protein